MTKRKTDGFSFEERRAHLRSTKGRGEALIAERVETGPVRPRSVDTTADRRTQLRLSMQIPVRLEPAAGGATHTARNCDISWGGLRLIAPKSAVGDADLVTVRLPWSKNQQIIAKVKILRQETLDDERCILAGRFCELSTSAHHRLEKLLQMLRRTDDDSPEHEVPLVPILELLFDDVAELREKLAQISEGHLSVATFGSYKPGQSIRLVLGGIADAPTLRLRARVNEAQALGFDTGPDWKMYDLDLRFEHPLEELKVAVSSLERYLPSQEAQEPPSYDSYILLDPLDPDAATDPPGPPE